MPILRHRQRAITSLSPVPGQGRWINPNKQNSVIAYNFAGTAGAVTDQNIFTSRGLVSAHLELSFIVNSVTGAIQAIFSVAFDSMYLRLSATNELIYSAGTTAASFATGFTPTLGVPYTVIVDVTGDTTTPTAEVTVTNRKTNVIVFNGTSGPLDAETSINRGHAFGTSLFGGAFFDGMIKNVTWNCAFDPGPTAHHWPMDENQGLVLNDTVKQDQDGTMTITPGASGQWDTIIP